MTAQEMEAAFPSANVQRENQKVIRKAMNLFMLLFLVVIFLLGGGAAVLYRMDMRSYVQELMSLEVHSLDLQVAAIDNALTSVVGDVLFLAEENELILHLDSGDPALVRDMRREYERLAKNRPAYDQIRFLDATGMERVRVNNRDGILRPVPEAELQDKGNRYYFRDCFALDERAIYLSPLDLNVENGQVEQPPRPMMRIGTPVFDSAGNKRGIVLINYAAADMLEHILRAGIVADGTSMLLNEDGYWLLGPDETKEWGFMYLDKGDATFARDFPDEWLRMRDAEQGQFRTGNGLFTFRTIHPHKKLARFGKSLNAQCPAPGKDGKGPYHWVLLSRIGPEVLNDFTRALLIKLFLGGGALFMAVALGAWNLALAVSRRRLYQAQLFAMAMYDALTGLPNRKLFFDRLGGGIESARRYGRRLALLYVDLDGFKQVNDTMGHQTGDELLVQVGKALRRTVRKSDTVARLGGDEFAIILSEVGSVEEAVKVGEKIVDELCRPFELRTATAKVGASVGVAVFPDHASQADTLVRGADKAMYRSKSKGRGTCTVAEAVSA
ncbi:sensor domain-containing diguanylate cyclase [Pseudodesulfovibrio indicus]|uniref:Diguanylate cyclase (GGDEF)-like protein n=2 Tax=Pseudodesulfovibrio indicus TaxID=1716143 RepID=A0AA94TIS0_9BACT|nr:sensor domain-containing diguanylate cyclase [Pseudodesulfovibrio indicus]TDT82725.1 diguanylate cyclase (GGDEF)-like protein [Pseudodesulfovibrio indicus]